MRAVLDQSYLEAGLLALSRVGDRHWNTGHYGAAVIAAYYFAHEQGLDEAASMALARQLDRLIARHDDLFLPAGLDRDDDADLAPIVRALDRNIGQLRAIGHNVIFASLALKALRQLPQLATRAAIDGLTTLLAQFDDYGPGRPFYGWEDPTQVRIETVDDIPVYRDEATIARTALDAFAAIEKIYPFLHQGIVGHLLTHAHALIELARLGYTDIAGKGHDAHRLYIKLSRNPPDEGEPIPKRDDPEFSPSGAAYWQRDLEGNREWLVGHVFKYTYSFYDLIRHIDDDAERRRFHQQLAYVLTAT